MDDARDPGMGGKHYTQRQMYYVIRSIRAALPDLVAEALQRLPELLVQYPEV